MQSTKGRASPSKVLHKTSPAKSQTAHRLKIVADSDSTSPHPTNRTPKEGSSKVIDRKSPKSPAPEKKRPSTMSDLESQLGQLQEDLKKTKEQLSFSESWKKQAQQEADEAKKQFLAMSAKYEESQQKLVDLSASEEDRVQELRKISHDRDQAWESEVEAIQKQHSMDTAALASALNEIQKLKMQLEMAGKSEAAQTMRAESAYVEIQHLRSELAQTLSLVDKMKSEIIDCKEVEAQTLEAVRKTQAQLETAKATEEALRSDTLKAKEAYNMIAAELEQSKAKVSSVEGLVSKFQSDLDNSSIKSLEVLPCLTELGNENNEHEESDQLSAELNLVKLEASQLRSALEAAEVRYQEEYIQSTFQIRLAYEQVEQEKLESCLREAELKEELKKARADIEEMKANMMDKETDLHRILVENGALKLNMEKEKAYTEELKADLMNKETELHCILEARLREEPKKARADIEEIKANMMDKETELCGILEENEALKLNMEKEKAYTEELKADLINKETELHCILEENEALKLNVEKVKVDIEELKANLMDKETELQHISEENEALNLKTTKYKPTERGTEMEIQLKKLEADLVGLNARLTDKGVTLQNLIEENETLKFSIQEREMSRDKTNNEVVAMLDVARAAEQEALVKVGYLTEEADESSRRALLATEQLDAAHAANSALEAEMRRLKVQLDQWRKAAEAAATMLSPRSSGKLMDRTGSLDSNYKTIGAKISSPYSDCSDDEDLLKKKNGNVLKKIGVLWKKGHNK